MRPRLHVRPRMPYSRALSMPVLLLATAGCFAQSELPLRPPPDPAVVFPDAEVVLMAPDGGVPEAGPMGRRRTRPSPRRTAVSPRTGPTSTRSS